MSKRAIIYDFDGTIADSEKVILDTYNALSERRGWPELTHKRYVTLRRGSPQQAMKWAGIRVWQLPRLLRTARLEYRKHKDEIKLFPYMANTIRRSSDIGYDVYVLSTNSRDTVKSILGKNGINGRVSVLKSSSIFGKHKIIKRLVRKNGYNARLSWMVGDEIRDLEAAKSAGLNSVGVSWGLQSVGALKQHEPTAIAAKPADILKAVQTKGKRQ